MVRVTVRVWVIFRFVLFKILGLGFGIWLGLGLGLGLGWGYGKV